MLVEKIRKKRSRHERYLGLMPRGGGWLLVKLGGESADEARAQSKPLVQYSLERRESNLQLREYLYENVYYSPEVYEPNRRAIRMLEIAPI